MALNSQPSTTACDQAFTALKTYDRGSARASLLPIDKAVMEALRDPAARHALEPQLVAALRAGGSIVAREYLCAKLALLGAASAVPALAPLLSDPQLATAARNALEAIPGNEASKTLRKSLAKAIGDLKIGIIQSLGTRRDTGSVGDLLPLLESPDSKLAGAAAAALGEIGSPKAARGLAKIFGKASPTLQRELADAMLIASRRLADQGRNKDSQALLNAIVAASLPTYIRKAAERAQSITTQG
jgi:HEAT repeat protein